MKSRREILLTLPSLGWLAVFFALPCLLILALAFRTSDLRGGVGDEWTLATLRLLAVGDYLNIVWQTVWMSAAATVLCLMLALPMSWALGRMSTAWRQAILLLVIVPFLTNFIIRVFAWKSLLHPEGIIKKALVWQIGRAHV